MSRQIKILSTGIAVVVCATFAAVLFYCAITFKVVTLNSSSAQQMGMIVSEDRKIPSALDRMPTSAYLGKYISTNVKVLSKKNRHAKVHAIYFEAIKKIQGDGGDESVVDEARALLLKAQKIDPNYPPLFAAYAVLAMNEGFTSGWNYRPGALTSAQMHLNRGFAKDPRYLVLHLVQLQLYEAQRNWAKVKKLATELLRVKPAREFATLSFARSALEQGRPAEAVKVLNSFFRTTPPSAFALAIVADAYEDLKDYKKAEDAYRKRLEITEVPHWEHHNFAIFLNRRERYDEAIKEERLALSISDFGAAHSVLAKSYREKAKELNRKNQLELAYVQIKKSLKEDPDDPDASRVMGYTLGQIATKTQDRAKVAEAIRYYEVYLKANPDDVKTAKYVDEIRAILAH